MGKVVYSRKAIEDLTSIWKYTAEEWSEKQADAYYRMLVSSIRKLLERPLSLGRSYDEIAFGLRGCKAGRHILFYRICGNGDVEIIRILHQRMDLKRRMQD